MPPGLTAPSPLRCVGFGLATPDMIPAKAAVDLAMTLASGGEAIADLTFLRDQSSGGANVPLRVKRHVNG
jgi:hypothetical protein